MYINEADLVLIAPVSGSILDNYLAKGFYRYRQVLFTTFYIEYLGTLYDVFWLRTDVTSVKAGSAFNKILRQNKSFTYTITRLQITPEMENLFALYREYVPFEHAQSIHDNLYGDSTHWDSWMDIQLVENELILNNKKVKVLHHGGGHGATKLDFNLFNKEVSQYLTKIYESNN